jgi:hypothetical protein
LQHFKSITKTTKRYQKARDISTGLACGCCLKERQQDKESRDRVIVKAVDKYVYSQKEIADTLRILYSTINRILMNKTAKNKTRPHDPINEEYPISPDVA